MLPAPPVEVEPAPARTLPDPAIWKQEPPQQMVCRYQVHQA